MCDFAHHSFDEGDCEAVTGRHPLESSKSLKLFVLERPPCLLTPFPGNTDGDFESETERRRPLALSWWCGNFPPEFHHTGTGSSGVRGSTAVPRDRELTLRYLPAAAMCTLVLNLTHPPIPCC